MASGASKTEGKPKKSRVRRILRIVLLAWLGLLLALFAVLVLRMQGFDSKQVKVDEVEVALSDGEGAVQRLSRALQFQTISSEDGKGTASQAFYDLHGYLYESFPLVHQKLLRENVANYSLLYTWRGTDPGRKPVLLAAHLDVVPARAERWSHPPFSGRVEAGFVWGRGALDDKGSAMAILEAVEELLRQGFEPQQTVYLAFGHDEEVGGFQGAKAIAEMLAARKVTLEATIDEGLVITEGVLDDMSRPVALIGIAEKGFLNVELVARGEGGHSSMPPRKTAVGVLSSALHKLQGSPMPGAIDGAVQQMFEYIGPEYGFGKKLVMANLWLFGGIVEGMLSKKTSTDAVLRSTIAPTMLEGSNKSNVLPQTARAVVNVRIKPGDSKESVLAHFKKVIGDKRVEIRGLGDEPVSPQPASSTRSRVFEIMMRSIRSLDPEIIVAPGLMIAYTDSRHYAPISEDIYRFLPFRYGPEDLTRLHGVDERISVQDYQDAIRFYLLLLRSLAGSN